MRRIFLAIFLSLLPSTSASSACVETARNIYTGQSRGFNNFIVISLTCTASATDASFTSKTITGLKGWSLYRVITSPGSTAPTDNSNLTLKDTLGAASEDLLGTNGTGGVDNATKNTIFPRNTYHSLNDYPPILGTLTLAITNNSVNSAITYIRIVGAK